MWAHAQLAGLSLGNVASLAHAGSPHPRRRRCRSLKMRFVAGWVGQAVLPRIASSWRAAAAWDFATR